MQCFICNKEIPDNSNVCPYCGNQIGNAQNMQQFQGNPQPQQPVMPQPNQGPVLGQDMMPNQAYYGQPVNPNPQAGMPPYPAKPAKPAKAAKSPKPAKAKKTAPRWVVVLLSVLLAIAIIGLGVGTYFFIDFRSNYDEWIDYGNEMAAKYDTLKEAYDKVEQDRHADEALLNIYKKYIVWVGAEEHTTYHSDYECPDFTDSSFRAFNKTTAEEFGYVPCSRCVK